MFAVLSRNPESSRELIPEGVSKTVRTVHFDLSGRTVKRRDSTSKPPRFCLYCLLFWLNKFFSSFASDSTSFLSLCCSARCAASARIRSWRISRSTSWASSASPADFLNSFASLRTCCFRASMSSRLLREACLRSSLIFFLHRFHVFHTSSSFPLVSRGIASVSVFGIYS